MKIDLYEQSGLCEHDIRRIERVLGLHEGTIGTEAAPPRASEHCDFYIKVGFVDHGKKLI